AKADPLARRGDERLAAEAQPGDRGGFVHHGHYFATKHSVEVVGLVRQNNICNMYLRREARFLLAHRFSFPACLPYYINSVSMHIRGSGIAIFDNRYHWLSMR